MTLSKNVLHLRPAGHVADFERLFKLDDDVSMLSCGALDGAIAELRHHIYHYAGTVAHCAATDTDYMGWHINKCHEKTFERRGISHMASGHYVMGGQGYQLSHRSCRLIRSGFLANPMLYSEPRYALLEDAMIGLMLKGENINCHMRSSAQLGLLVQLEKRDIDKTAVNEFELLGHRLSQLLAPSPR